MVGPENNYNFSRIKYFFHLVWKIPYMIANAYLLRFRLSSVRGVSVIFLSRKKRDLKKKKVNFRS